MIFAAYDKTKPLYGIFNKLHEKQKLKLVQIDGESNSNCKTGADTLIIDEKDESIFWYSTSEKQYVTFTFPYPVMITGYTFQNAAESIPHTYLKDWKIEGYDKANEMWEQIDYKENQKFCESSYSCSERNTISYPIEHPQNIFRSIRVTCIENSYSEVYNYFILSAIEFFGTMKISNTCKSSNFHFFNLKYLLIIMLYFK